MLKMFLPVAVITTIIVIGCLVSSGVRDMVPMDVRGKPLDHCGDWVWCKNCKEPYAMNTQGYTYRCGKCGEVFDCHNK